MITTEEPVEVTPVRSPEQYLLEYGGDVAVYVVSFVFIVRALGIREAITAWRLAQDTQRQLLEEIRSKVPEVLEYVERTSKTTSAILRHLKQDDTRRD